MATIKPKRGTGAPTGLAQNELAVNTVGRIIYLGNAGGTGDIVASHTTVRGLSGTVGASAGTGISITNSGNTFTISLNAGLGTLSDVTSTVTSSAKQNEGLVYRSGRWENTPVVLSLNGASGDVTAVTSLAAAAGISLSGSTGAVTIQNIGVVSLNGATGTITNVAKTDTAQTFSGLQTFSTGVSAASIFTATVGGDEGGQIDFGNPVTNTSLTGGVAIDIYQNRMRFFEKGGSARGFYIDLTSGAGGVGTNLVASGGGVSTLNNLSGAVVLAAGNNVTITPSGNTLTIAAELSGASAGVTTIRGLSGTVGVSAGTGISVTTSGNTLSVANTGVISFGNSTTSGGTYGIRVSGTTGSGIFLTNTGVTTAIGGTGISVSGATGTVTFTNTGVTRLIGGNNITLSPPGGTGQVTISVSTPAVNSFNGFIGNIYFGMASGSGITVQENVFIDGGDTTYTYTITNAGVTGITGTANEITVSGTTGFVTIGLPDSITVLDLNTDQVDFNTNPGSTAMAQGRMLWDSVESTVGLGMNSNVTCKIGENLYKFAHNSTGSPINKGEVVYVSGSQGETLLRIAKAQANAESTSANTIGVAAETIAHGATGFIAVFGLLTGIATNTIGAAAGDPIYLSETTAGGLRAGLPTQPNHGVRVGFLVKSAGAGSGAIFVNVQNYQELEELSDVYVSGVTSNHMLLWDSTDGRWENRSPTDVRSALGLSSFVSTVNGATGAVIFAAGSNITITPSGNTFTIASLGGGGGGVSTVNGLSGAVGLAVGLGLTLTSSGNTLNIAGLTASTSQIGVASFNSTNFSVSGGVVSITAINGGTF